jgi:hypothetical protein
MGVRNWAAILGISAILSTSADAEEPGAGGRISWKKTTIEGGSAPRASRPPT